MSTPATSRLRIALNADLKKLGTKGLGKVVNDLTRKTFTANTEGAILEFAHKQIDPGFWVGVKYYGSGTHNRVRIRRTPALDAESAAK